MQQGERVRESGRPDDADEHVQQSVKHAGGVQKGSDQHTEPNQ